MPDYTKFVLDRVLVTEEAVMPTTTANGFRRSHFVKGKGENVSTTLSFEVDDYAVVKIRALKTRDGRWRALSIEADLPALLYGHSGRAIKTSAEVTLALTRLVHIVKAVIQQECHCRILPGVGQDNHGYIRRWESMIQVQDPDHAFLLGCHLARLKHQQKTPRIHPTESIKLRTREVDVSVYDKGAKIRHGMCFPEDIPGTRIEVVMKDEVRLAKDAKATKLFSGKPGPVLATFSLDAEYAIIRATLNKITGIGWLADRKSMHALSKNAKLIAGSLGAEITDIRRLTVALQAYKKSCAPSPNIFNKIANELHAYALRVVIPDPLTWVPESHADLLWSEVHWAEREGAWAVLMRDIGAPDVADPAIAAAWSKTAFLPFQPLPRELIGDVAPSALPFLKTL